MRKSESATADRDETGVGHAKRWILMLPLAAFCAAMTYGASAIGLSAVGYALLGPTGNGDPTVAALTSTAASAAMAYVFVWCAVVIAPSSRVRVAQALIGVGTAIAAIAMYDAALASGTTEQFAADGSLASGAGFIAGLLAAGFSLRRLRH